MRALKPVLIISIVVLLALAAATAFGVSVQAAKVAAPPSQPAAPSGNTIDLAGPWKFSTDREEGGQALGWQKPDFDASKWRVLNAPGAWEDQGITAPNPNWPDWPENEAGGGYNGYAWYRKTVTVPADWTTGTMTLRIGAIHDSDWTYVNGVQVGMTTGEDAYEKLREYTVPQTVLRPGQPNVIAVRVLDIAGAGGIHEGPVELTREAAGAEAATAGEAGGAPEERAYAEHSSGITKIGEGVEVPAGMQVDGDVLSVGGTVTIDGHVTGSAQAVGGSVIVHPGGRLDGDAVTVGGQVIRQGDAVIGGQTVQSPLPEFLAGRLHPSRPRDWWPFDFRVGFLWWLFLGLFAALVFPRRLEVMARALPTAPGTTALLGAAGIALIPGVIIADALVGAFVIVILALTLVGIIAIPAAAVAMAAVIAALPLCVAFGVVAVWLSLGRAIVGRLDRRQTHTVPAMLVGLLAILLLCRLPVFGVMIMITVAIFGAGLALVTGLGTSERWIWQKRERAAAAPEPPATEPAPPAEEPVVPSEEAVSAEEEPVTPTEEPAPSVEERAALPEPTKPAEEGEGEAEERPEPPPV